MAANQSDFKQAAMPHTVVIENRQSLTASGIKQVIAYDEYSVTVETENGTLIIGGKNIRVNEVSKSSGDIKVSGDIEYLQYQGKKEKGEGFFKRLVR